MSNGWEDRAEQWMAWARTPAHDAYWRYRDHFFELLPTTSTRILEVGCGEGRVARDLVSLGHSVVGIDASPTLLRAARAAGTSAKYELATAEALPFDSSMFGAVVMYNSLTDIADMPRAVREAARVLASHGCLCVCVPHPFSDAGRWSGIPPDVTFSLRDAYLDESVFEETYERDGLSMRFDGHRYPLEAYSRACEAAGLAIDAVREPKSADAHRDERWQRMPMFLMFRARRNS